MRGLMAGAAGALLLLSGCEIGPQYVPPKPPPVTTYTQAAAPNSVAIPSAPDPAWWKAFADPVLDSLIAQAVAGNLDLQAAQFRLVEARAQREAVAAPLFPSLGVSGAGSRNRNSSTLFPTGIGPGPNGGSGAAAGQALQKLFGTMINFFELGFDASWEIDVFGGHRRALEAADASVEAVRWQRRGLLVSTLAEVGIDYAALRTTQSRLLIARHNLEVEQDLAGLTGDRYRGGLASELDVAQAQTVVAQTRAAIPPLETELGAHQRALALLVGRTPEAVDARLLAPGVPLRRIPHVPVGLPASLLQNRPDVRAAERALAAASARIGQARAAQFPQFALTAQYGLESEKLRSLVEHASSVWSLGGNVSAPLFDAGARAANVDVARAQFEQARLAYDSTALQALREVEDALQACGNDRAQREALEAGERATEVALGRARDQYRAGLGTFINVLDAERQVQAAQDGLAQADLGAARDLIALYKALGGGWQVSADATTAHG